MAAVPVTKLVPVESAMTTRVMIPFTRVGAAVNTTERVVALKAPLLEKVSTEPPPIAARLAKVRVALAAPALFRVTRFPPQDEPSAPKLKAEAEVPLPVKAKFPVTRVNARPAPIRVRTLPVSSTPSKALLWTVMAPDVPVS